MELPVLRLVVEKGPRKGETLERHPGAVARIGRVLKGNDLAVRDSGASQKHLLFEFLREASRWAVSDLDTSNGTVVNDGDLIPPSVPFPLSSGDVIKIGESTSIAVHIVGANEREQPLAAGEQQQKQHKQQDDVEEQIGTKDARRRGWRAARLVPPLPPPVEDSSVMEDTRGGAALVPASRNSRRGKTRQNGDGNLEEEDAPTEQELLAEKPKGRRGRRPATRSTSVKSTKEEDEVVGEKSNPVQISDMKSRAAPVKGRVRGGRRPATRSSTVSASTEEQELVAEPFSSTAVPEAAHPSEKEGSNSKVEDSGRIQEDALPEEMEIDMDKMTLGEWFDRMEKLLPRMIGDVSDEIIASLREKARLFEEFIATSSNDV